MITEYVYKLLEEEVQLKRHVVPVSDSSYDHSYVEVIDLHVTCIADENHKLRPVYKSLCETPNELLGS